MNAQAVKIRSIWTIVTWDKRHSQWQCAGDGSGYGTGRTPESAARAAYFDGHRPAYRFRTKREALAEIEKGHSE